MEVNVATTSLQWSARRAVFPQCPSSSQTLTSSKRRRHRHRREGGGDLTSGGSLACHYRPRPMFNNSAFPGTQSSKLHRSKSCEFWELSKPPTTKKHNTMRRVCSVSSNFYQDEEFSKHIQELALKFRIAGGEEGERENKPEIIHGNGENDRYGRVELLQESVSGLHSMGPPWPEMVNHSSFLRKANSVDLPHSLRIIRRKLQQEGLREASESTGCSVRRAFSSVVFMMEEMNSFTLQTREAVLCEDLKGIIRRVQKEMHASFLWLFQCVFSHTPTLMVYVMLLLANFTVHSMGSSAGMAAAILQPADGRRRVEGEGSPISKVEGQRHESFKGPIPTEGGRCGSRKERSKSKHKREGEEGMWEAMVEEAERMGGGERIEVAAVEARMEGDEYEEYERTEVMYQMRLAEEPDNPLLLANYAQFLYVVTRDYDRAEEYFERATEEGGDAEAYSKYGNFMWRARKDLWAAEEKLLEAMSMEPTSSFYAGNYAHFLWNTGADDTCFPLP